MIPHYDASAVLTDDAIELQYVHARRKKFLNPVRSNIIRNLNALFPIGLAPNGIQIRNSVRLVSNQPKYCNYNQTLVQFSNIKRKFALHKHEVKGYVPTRCYQVAMRMPK